MAYFLGCYAEDHNSIEIEVAQYAGFEQARRTIIGLAEIESLFSVLARSYVNFEKLLCELSVECMCVDWEIDRFDDYNERLNVSLMTILSAVNAYHDQRKSILKSSEALSEADGSVEDEFSNAYDQSFEYRLMEMMINYSKHNRLPVESITIGGAVEWDGGKPQAGNDLRQYVSVCPFFGAERIAEKRHKLKTVTVDELSAKGCKRVDIKSYLRSYVSDLANCHIHLKKETALAFKAAEETLKYAQSVFLEAFPSQSENVDFLHIWSSENINQKKYLCFQSLPQLRRKRNDPLRSLSAVSRKFVSTASIRHASTVYSDNSLYVQK